ncbi:hypothetical protein JVU11DRAFT_9984 [Chiua virens]|nr:hypothetical protein JVU11DRAFT_9984 [Chiua virens]
MDAAKKVSHRGSARESPEIGRKKLVPKGYLEAFNLAEKVFLHQRREKLAEGNLDPITLLPIVDINPSFVPRVSKSLPLHFNRINHPSTDKGKGKTKTEQGTVGLLHFFSPKGLSRSNSAPTRKSGRNSGKRTLCGVLDNDLASKRIKTECNDSDVGRGSLQNVPCAVKQDHAAFPTPDELPEASSIFSQHHRDDLKSHGKENIDPGDHFEDDLDEPPDPTPQEDGYMSPSPPHLRLATPDLSSPIGHSLKVTPRRHGSTDDFGADIISSPLAIKRQSPWFRKRSAPLREPAESEYILVRGTPPSIEGNIGGPDLRDMLIMDEVEEHEGEETLGAITSQSGLATNSIDATMPAELDPDTCVRESRVQTVANGWWNKWALTQEPQPGHTIGTPFEVMVYATERHWTSRTSRDFEPQKCSISILAELEA